MDDLGYIFDVVEHGNFKNYRNCIGRFDINITNEDGVSLLHKAIAYQHSEIAMDLIRRSINVNIQDNNGQSSLHYLGFFKNLEIAKEIIINGGNLELKDDFGNTPLWYAVFNARGNYDFVELLVKNKANPNSMNKAERTPQNFAYQINDQRLIEILKR